MSYDHPNQQGHSGPGHNPPYPSQPPGAQGQWVYQAAAPQRTRLSGYRVASGILAIVLSLFELLFFANSAYMAATWSADGGYVTTAVVLAILGLGTLTTGIVLLAQSRRRNRITPVVLMALSASAIVAAAALLFGELYGAPLLVISILLGVPILIVLGIGLSKEKHLA